MATIRTMNDSVEYEFGLDRQLHMETAHKIVRTALTAVALIWNELAVLHKEEDADFLTDPNLVDLRRKLAEKMDGLVASVLQEPAASMHQEISEASSSDLASAGSATLEHPRYGQYAQNTIARYRELQSLVAGLTVRV